MATKNKKKLKSVDPLQRARRAMEKEDFRSALKEARVSHRQAPSEASRTLLERAHLGRAEQLQRLGMTAEARGVLEGLLALGVTDAGVEGKLPPILVATGLVDRAKGMLKAPLELDFTLSGSAADHAVRRPDEAPASLPELGRGARQIRSALDSLAGGDERSALETVKDIPRSSPFADWRLFVRGLAAYYRRDVDQMRANWDRLDPQRDAAQIAASLRMLAEPSPSDRAAQEQRRQAVDRIERAVFGESVAAPLMRLQEHFAAGRWRSIRQAWRGICKPLARRDPALARRVGQELISRAILQGNVNLVRELSRDAALPLDPRGNRAAALALRESLNKEDEGEDAAQARGAESRWLEYLADLDHVAELTDGARAVARSLVWVEIGRMRSISVEQELGRLHHRIMSFGRVDDDSRAQEGRLREWVLEAFREGIRAAPDQIAAYRALVRECRAWNKPEVVLSALEMLLARFPDDLPTLEELARHHLEGDDPERAAEYAMRARQLKPLDARLNEIAYHGQIALAAAAAQNRQWEKGRAALQAAGTVAGNEPPPWMRRAREALFAFRSNELDRGHELLAQAKRMLAEPTAVLLLLAFEARQWGLPADFAAKWRREFLAAARKRCQSETLTAICRAARPEPLLPKRREIDEELDRAVVDYVGRSSRIKWQHAAFCDAARHLIWFRDECDPLPQPKSLPKCILKAVNLLVRRGRDQFPEEPLLHLVEGERLLIEPPWADRILGGPPAAVSYLERYLAMTSGQEDAVTQDFRQRSQFAIFYLTMPHGLREEFTSMVEEALDSGGSIERVRDAFEMFAGAVSPMGPPPFMGPPHFIDDEDFDDLDDDEFDDDGFGEDGDGSEEDTSKIDTPQQQWRPRQESRQSRHRARRRRRR